MTPALTPEREQGYAAFYNLEAAPRDLVTVTYSEDPIDGDIEYAVQLRPDSQAPRSLAPAEMEGTALLCFVNGYLITREEWGATLHAGDVVAFQRLPGGFGDFLSLALIVVASIALPGVGAAIASGLTSIGVAAGLAGTLGTAIASLVVSFGIGLLAQALAPDVPKGLPLEGGSFDNRLQTNRARYRGPQPICYGQVWMFPDLVAQETVRGPGFIEQRKLLTSLGPSNIELEGVYADDTLIMAFTRLGGELAADNVSADVRRVWVGFKPPGTPFTLFNFDTQPFGVSDYTQQVPSEAGEITNVSSRVYASPEAANLPYFEAPGQSLGGFPATPPGYASDRIDVRVSFPRGIYATNGDGDIVLGESRPLEIYLTPIDDAGRPTASEILLGSWNYQMLRLAVFTANQYTFQPVDPTLSPITITGDTAAQPRASAAEDYYPFLQETGDFFEATEIGVHGRNNFSKEMYIRIVLSDSDPYPATGSTSPTSPGDGVGQVIPPGRYSVRIQQLGDRYNTESNDVNDGEWSALYGYCQGQEIPDDHKANLLTLTLLGGPQTRSFGQRKLNCRVSAKLPTWDPVEGWSDPVVTRNPVWAFCDVVRNQVYGMGLPDTALDMPYLYDLALCFETNGETFDHIFDSTVTARQALQVIAAACRCQMTERYGVFSMKPDTPGEYPAAVFSVADIEPGSFSLTYSVPGPDEPAFVEVEYFDDLLKRTTTVSAAVPDAGSRTAILTIQAPGITDERRALNLANIKAKEIRYRRRSISFDAGPKAYSVEPGDTILVSPKPRVGGFVRGGATNATDLLLSEDVPDAGTIVFEFGASAYTRVADGVSEEDKDGQGALIALNDPDVAAFAISRAADIDSDPPTYVIIPEGEEPRPWRVVAVEPRDLGGATIRAIAEDPRIYADVVVPEPNLLRSGVIADPEDPPDVENPVIIFETAFEDGEYAFRIE